MNGQVVDTPRHSMGSKLHDVAGSAALIGTWRAPNPLLADDPHFFGCQVALGLSNVSPEAGRRYTGMPSLNHSPPLRPDCDDMALDVIDGRVLPNTNHHVPSCNGIRIDPAAARDGSRQAIDC